VNLADLLGDATDGTVVDTKCRLVPEQCFAAELEDDPRVHGGRLGPGYRSARCHRAGDSCLPAQFGDGGTAPSSSDDERSPVTVALSPT